ncbi:MAG: hypothetical protein IKC01_01445 [Clostridia bacterium]|nr:hypothetical protein [Clostridia bacterium]
MKKVLSLIIVFLIVISSVPVTIASAADVIEISSAAQLASIGNNDSYPLNGSYKLTKNISLSEYDSWTPIGSSTAFSGTFEGNGKTISGLKVNTSGAYAGLFGQVSGTVKNLEVIGTVTLNYSSSSVTSVYAGLLAGSVSGWFAVIDSCSTSGEVNATMNCTASWGFGTANVYAGGVVGNNSSWIASEVLSHKSGAVNASYTGSSVSGNAYAGGIAGKTTAGIVDSFNKAAVSSSSSKGSSYAGGLAGSCASTETSYNTGNVTAGTYCGSIAGYATGTSTNCYYLTDSAAQAFGGYSGSTAPSATAKKSSDMTNKKLSGFNFDDVWESSLFGPPGHYEKNEIITGSVSVLGSFQVGEKLTADMSQVSPTSAYDGVIKYVKYQWERGTKDSDGNIAYEKISGATSDNYTLTSSDLGKYVRLVVRGRFNYGGKLESKETLVTAAVPKNVKAATDDNGVKVSWDKISGATQYTIYRSDYTEGTNIFGTVIGGGFSSFNKVGTSTTNSYLDEGVVTNKKYKYKVTVTMGGVESEQSQESNEITAQLACNHTWDSGKETTAAKCETTGVKTYTCTICGGTKTEVIPATGHSYNNGTVTKQATCEENGEKSFFCSKCWTTKTEVIPATGHNYDSGKITTQATCEAAGVKTFTCENCRGSYTETIPATGHNYDGGVVTTQPTCETEGVKTYTCSNCQGKKTEAIAALGHNFENPVITKQPTCLEPGEKTGTCLTCGKTTTEAIPATGHSYNNGNITTPATCEGIGEKVFVCTACGVAKSEILPALGHNFSAAFTVDREATYEAEGEKSRHCTRCDARTDITAIPKVVKVEMPSYQFARAKGGVQVTWSKVSNATGYEVYKAELKNGSWTSWQKVKTTDANATSYLDTRVISGNSYRYAVSALPGEFSYAYEGYGSVLFLATPVIASTASTERGINFTWNSVAGVEGYIIYKKVAGSFNQIAVVGSATTGFTDIDVKDGETYTYAVAAMDGYGFAEINSEFTVTYELPKQEVIELDIPSVKIVNTSKGIKVTWNSIENAKSYVVYRRYYNTSSKKWSGWSVIKKGVSSTGVIDTTVKLGTNYRYTVKAVGENSVSKYKSTATLKYNVTPVVKAANVTNGIKVTWSTVANATGYTVYSSTYNAKTKKWSGWKNRGTAGKNRTSWVDKKAKSGAYYKYTVRAVYGSQKSSYKATANIIRLVNPTVKAVKTSNGIRVTWNKVAGAKNYNAYRAEYVNGKWSGWKLIATTNNRTVALTDATTKKGVTYKYTIRAVNGKNASSFTASKNVKR